MYVQVHIENKQVMVAKEDVTMTVTRQSEYTQDCRHKQHPTWCTSTVTTGLTSPCHVYRTVMTVLQWNSNTVKGMLPNVDECWQFEDLFELYDSRQCAPQICYLILKNWTNWTRSIPCTSRKAASGHLYKFRRDTILYLTFVFTIWHHASYITKLLSCNHNCYHATITE